MASLYNSHYYLILFTFTLYLTTTQLTDRPLPSCLHHYLNGNYVSGVYPISAIDDGDEEGVPFRVECIFPDPAIDVTKQSIVTVIHSGLEQWTKVGGEKMTVSYQISDWTLLMQIHSKYDLCLQDVHIQWASHSIEIANEDEMTIVIDVESMSGQLIQFKRNHSSSTQETIRLEGKKSGILHISSTASAATIADDATSSTQFNWIRSGPLKCAQTITNDCLFELRSDSDLLRVDVPAAALNDASVGSMLSFAFRTDQPTTKLLSVTIDGDGGDDDSGESIEVDLIDGYLINVNVKHILHPVKLLSDGKWHSVHLDLKTLYLHFDSPASTAISLMHSSSRSTAAAPAVKVIEVSVLMKAQVTALIVGSTATTTQQQLCPSSTAVQYIQSGPPLSICSNGSSFCQCKGPASAIRFGPGAVAAACAPPKAENAIRLSRASDRLAFLMVPDYTPCSSLSIVFKSDSGTGLLMFGSWMGALNCDGRDIIGRRLQVHYEGQTMYGALCDTLEDGREQCHSCSIYNPRGYSTGEWIRVSIFSHQRHRFMSVDERICQFSPNSEVIHSSDLYRVLHNGLFIGGMYYTKSSRLNAKVDSVFRRDFLDNTKEKPLSLRGCIAEISVRAIAYNLEWLLNEQINRVSKGDASVFSVFKGCVDCPPQCATAPCHFSSLTPQSLIEPKCECSSIYSAALQGNGGCVIAEEGPIGVQLPQRGSSLSLSTAAFSFGSITEMATHSGALIPSRAGRLTLDRIWMLLMFPQPEHEERTFMQIGALRISTVGMEDNLRVIVHADYGIDINEEFIIPSIDTRLHLLSIERSSSVGTALDKKAIIFRLDADKRHLLNLDELPIRAEDQLSISGHPPDGSQGCVAEFILNYSIKDDEEVAAEVEQRQKHDVAVEDSQLDVMALMVEEIRRRAPENNNLINEQCGIRDPSLWFGNSSPLGGVSPYNPDGAMPIRSGSFPKWISILLTILLIIVVLVALGTYFIAIARRRRKQRQFSFDYDRSYDEKFTGSTIAAKVEKRPPLDCDSRTSSSVASAPLLPLPPATATKITYNNHRKQPADSISSSIRTPDSPRPLTDFDLLEESGFDSPRFKNSFAPSSSGADNDFIIDTYHTSPPPANRNHFHNRRIRVPLLRSPIPGGGGHRGGMLVVSASGGHTINPPPAPIATSEEL